MGKDLFQCRIKGEEISRIHLSTTLKFINDHLGLYEQKTEVQDRYITIKCGLYLDVNEKSLRGASR